jgi:hypothetical protein
MLSLRNYLWTATTSCIGMDRVAEELLSMEAVFFDVDSTLSVDEGIDVLAEQLGVGLEVQRLTSQAMGDPGEARRLRPLLLRGLLRCRRE